MTSEGYIFIYVCSNSNQIKRGYQLENREHKEGVGEREVGRARGEGGQENRVKLN